MENAPFKIVDRGIIGEIVVEKEYFERDCILNVVSKYVKKYNISFFPIDEKKVNIVVKSKNGSNVDELALQNFFNDCIDEQVRLDLQKEFGALRDKIVEYAFSSAERHRE